jgi:hypothetical protein
MEDLQNTGKKINRVMSYVKGMIRKDELEAFNEYLGRMEAVGPLTNPEYFQGDGFKHIERAKARSHAIMSVLEVK